MIVFWIAVLAVTALAAGLIFLFSRRPVAVLADPAQAVYRRQLTEIDEMAQRGLLAEPERKSAYAEAARRLLSEPGAGLETQEDKNGAIIALVAMGAVAVVAAGAYLKVGKLGMADQPYAARLEAWRSQPVDHLGPDQVLALLKSAPRENMNDPSYLGYLADFEAQTGDLLSAQLNLERQLQIAPNTTSAWLTLAEVRFQLSEGKVTPDVRAALDKVVALDPKSLEARYLLAKGDIEAGHKDEGLAALRQLQSEAPADLKPRLAEEIAAIERGPVVAPAAPANPTAANPEIRAMVEGLAQRLEQSPDDVQGWARLIRSYQVMGDSAARDAALTKARLIFKDRPRDLATINQATSAPQ